MNKYIKKITHNSYKKTYSIVIPPPNITGKLHVGHAFQCTLIDILIRYYKAQNYITLWKVGTDHAGIATQIILDKIFKSKNIKNKTKFIKKWKNKTIKNIFTQLKSLGYSINWNTSRFTLDKHFSYAVKNAFINLFNKKLIYKDKQIVNWDPKLNTVISDLEVIHKTTNTKLYYIKYKIKNTNNYILIATTRPETIFADAAIAFNPQDKRYEYLKNKSVEIPLINKAIPIIENKYVDINFGSGLLKVTPGHDFNDYKIGKQHKLKPIIIFSNKAVYKNVPKRYEKLDFATGKKKIINDLTRERKIYKIEEHKSSIPLADKTKNRLEHILKEQWFLRTKPLIRPVLNVIKIKKIKIIPIKWENTFYQWINNIKDWCISRQIWWGHKIPVWHNKENEIYVGYSKKDIINKYKLNKNLTLTQDSNVLDTWFSSALWPFASLGWPNKTKELLHFYPTDIIITGFDIIFFWIIRMIMFSIKFTKKIPFKEIYIHGLIRDNMGQKMSKTKGNVLDPLEVIKSISNINSKEKKKNILPSEKYNKTIKLSQKHNIDTLRLTFAAIATENIFLRLDLNKIIKYKNFCNKIWNIAKFINNNLNKTKNPQINNKYNLWIISLLERIKIKTNINFKKKNFSLIINSIYEFIWKDFANWYLELTKIVLKNKFYSNKTKTILKETFNQIIIILYPLAPFISLEIWNLINKKMPFNPTKKINENFINIFIEKNIFFLKKMCSEIRHQTNITKNKRLLLYTKNKTFIKKIEFIKPIFTNLLKLKKIKINYYKIKKNNAFNDKCFYNII